MKSFKQYITEAKKDLPTGNPGRMTPGDIEKFKKVPSTGERPKNLSTDLDTSGRTVRRRPVRVTNNPTGQTITNLPGGNVPDEQKFSQLERLAKERTSSSVKAADNVSTEMRTQAANTAARAKNTGPAQRRPLGEYPGAGQVRIIKPKQPAPAPKPETVKKPVPTLSRRGALSRQVDPIIKDLRSQGASQRALQSRMSAAVDKTRAADRALADKATEALRQIRADSKTPTTTELIKQTQQKPPTAPKPPTVTKSTLPTFASKGQTALPGVEKVKPGSRTLRGSAAQVNKPAPITKADVVRQSTTAVADAAKKARESGASRLKGFLKGAGYVGAGLEAAGEYKRRKDMGQDTATAAAGSGARVAGGAAAAKLAAGTAAKALSPLALAPFPGARPLYALGVGAAGVGGYTLGADWATKGFDYAKQNFKGFQDKANKAYQRLLLPQYRTKTEEFVPEEAEFTVEFVQRLKDFTAPVRNNPTVKAVTNNRFVRGAGRVLGGVEKGLLGLGRAEAAFGLIDPTARPSQKAIRAITTFAPPGIAHASWALTPSIDNSKFIRKNIDEPIIRSNKKIDKALGEPFTPGTSRNPNYPRIYRDMQKSGMPMF